MRKEKKNPSRSEDIEDLLGRPPSWLVKWGVVVLTGAIAFILFVSYLVKYPDTVSARVVILSKTPPIRINAKMNGRIEHLLVQNGQSVKSNQIIAVTENTAKYTSVYNLKSKLEAMKPGGVWRKKEIEDILKTDFPTGQIDRQLIILKGKLATYLNFQHINNHSKKVNNINQQIAELDNYISDAKKQASILKDRLELSKSQFLRDSLLFEARVLAPLQFETSKGNFLQSRYNYMSTTTDILQSRTRLTQLTQQIDDENHSYSDQNFRIVSEIIEAKENVLTEIRDWELSFVIKSPIDGTINFDNVWSENQYISAGGNLFTIIPFKPEEMIGRISLPISGSGKVHLGQKVMIRLDNFPYLEYGSLTGQVSSISLVPNINNNTTAFYVVETKLPKKLRSSYGQELSFGQELQGTAEIVTNDQRLLTRLIAPLYHLISQMK